MTCTARCLRIGHHRVWFFRRAFSEAAVAKEPAPLKLPIKHSRNKLPRVCTDPQQLQELTEEVLNTPVGSIFTFPEASAAEQEDPSRVAWHEADAVVQKVEFLLRGHAHGLEGTQWNRWLKKHNVSSPTDADESLAIMVALVDRLWEEGHTYMTLRAARLEEVRGPKITLDEGDLQEMSELEEGEVESLKKDMEEFAEAEGLELYEKQDAEQVPQEAEGGEDDIIEETYMDDFALPGPTVAMYDTLLDAMACSAPNSTVASPEAALSLFQDIVFRHYLDGGDASNTNIHTRPTVLSYNAPIRLSMSLPFDPANKQSEAIQRRDQAIQLAFGCFDELSQSSILKRNSATYNYLLGTVAKYMPASRIRGNIARGIWHHACTQGLVDETVMEAFGAANNPSNGEEFDGWKDRIGNQKKDFPAKWVRKSRGLRYHPREATY